MAASFIKHADLILKSLRNADVDDLLAADYALQCVDRLPVATRKQVGGLRAALEHATAAPELAAETTVAVDVEVGAWAEVDWAVVERAVAVAVAVAVVVVV